MHFDVKLLGTSSGNARQIAATIRTNIDKAAMLMDQGDVYQVAMTLSVEQAGEVADAKMMREHIARQLALIAVYLCVPEAEA